MLPASYITVPSTSAGQDGHGTASADGHTPTSLAVGGATGSGSAALGQPLPLSSVLAPSTGQQPQFSLQMNSNEASTSNTDVLGGVSRYVWNTIEENDSDDSGADGEDGKVMAVAQQAAAATAAAATTSTATPPAHHHPSHQDAPGTPAGVGPGTPTEATRQQNSSSPFTFATILGSEPTPTATAAAHPTGGSTMPCTTSTPPSASVSAAPTGGPESTGTPVMAMAPGTSSGPLLGGNTPIPQGAMLAGPVLFAAQPSQSASSENLYTSYSSGVSGVRPISFAEMPSQGPMFNAVTMQPVLGVPNGATMSSPVLDGATTGGLFPRTLIPAAQSFPPGATLSSMAGQVSSNASISGSTAGGNTSSAAGAGPSTSGNYNDDALRSNLFVCGLPPEVNDDELRELFSKYGDIESAKVMLDIHSGQSRCIAFVKFFDVADADKALEELNGFMLHDHQIAVRVANSRAAYLPGNPTNKTFVRNVPLTVSKSDLHRYFSQFGEVTDVSIHTDTAHVRGTNVTDQKLNIVFVTFASKEAAAKAAEETHTKAPFPECKGVPLLAKVAEDSTRRVERLARRYRPSGTSPGGTPLMSSPGQASPAAMGLTPTSATVAGFTTVMATPGTGSPRAMAGAAQLAPGGRMLEAVAAPPGFITAAPQAIPFFAGAPGGPAGATAPAFFPQTVFFNPATGTTTGAAGPAPMMFVSAAPPPPPPPPTSASTGSTSTPPAAGGSVGGVNGGSQTPPTTTIPLMFASMPFANPMTGLPPGAMLAPGPGGGYYIVMNGAPTATVQPGTAATMSTSQPGSPPRQ